MIPLATWALWGAAGRPLHADAEPAPATAEDWAAALIAAAEE